jgi:hypothetical protein
MLFRERRVFQTLSHVNLLLRVMLRQHHSIEGIEHGSLYFWKTTDLRNYTDSTGFTAHQLMATSSFCTKNRTKPPGSPRHQLFCTKNHTKPPGSPHHQLILYEKSHKTTRFTAPPALFVRKIIQNHPVHRITSSFCTKNHTKPPDSPHHQLILYEKSYKTSRFTASPAHFVRKIAQNHPVHRATSSFCTKIHTKPPGSPRNSPTLYEKSFKSNHVEASGHENAEALGSNVVKGQRTKNHAL